MAEEIKPNNINQNNIKSTETEQKEVKKKENKKSKPKKEDRIKYFYLPDKVKTFRFKVLSAAINIIKQEPFIREKDLILKIIATDPSVKEYFAKTGDLSYIRYAIWKAVKDGLIIQVKLIGDEKHTYLLLPEQYDQFKQYEYKTAKEE